MKKPGNNNLLKESNKIFLNVKPTKSDNNNIKVETENKCDYFQISQNHTEINNENTKNSLLAEKNSLNFPEKNSKGFEETYFQFQNYLDQTNFNQNFINLSNNNSGINKDKDNIKVTARIRPRNEKESEHCNFLDVKNNAINLKNRPEETYNFDFVASEEISQEQMFEKCAREVADNVLLGYNGTIFAYGQTSAGKTYTLIGSRENIHDKINNAKNLYGNLNANYNSAAGNEMKNFLSVNSQKRGIMPRAIEYILKKTEKKEENTTISLSCSFLEIYNEELRDLLDDKNPSKKIEIREINENQEEEKHNNNNKNKNSNRINPNILKGFDKKNNNEKEKKVISIPSLVKLKFESYSEATNFLAQGKLVNFLDLLLLKT